MISTADRLTGFFDSTIPAVTVATRTPAQREASRHNGQHSRGPKTAEGKAIACRNSLKHGLFARQCQPPDDFRRLRPAYRRIRAELIAQYRPTSFTEAAEIDALASDMLRAARARGVIEAAMCPPALPSRIDASWRRVPAVEANLKAARHALTALEHGELPLLPQAAAERLGKSLAGLVSVVAADVAAADAEDQGDAPSPAPAGMSPAAAARVAGREAFDAEELRGLRALIATLGQAVKKYQDAGHLTEWLTGHRTVTMPTRNRLIAVLRHKITNTTSWLVGQQEEARPQVERATANKLAALSQDPGRLLLLETYLGRIERGIARAKDRLEQRRAGFVFPKKSQAATRD
jgi:hypothetical protein